jgi:prepilin-type N-terminal cleavage/methylation domain-containing protein
MTETDKMSGGEPASAWGGAGEGFNDRKGFTILELMIVGVVLGILAGIAIPVYLTYLKRAKQVEAPVALTEIKRLEAMHFAFSGAYGRLDEIGFQPGLTQRYYQFTLEVIPGAGGQPAGFKATATANLDSDDEEDIWTITQDGILKHPGVD